MRIIASVKNNIISENGSLCIAAEVKSATNECKEILVNPLIHNVPKWSDTL